MYACVAWSGCQETELSFDPAPITFDFSDQVAVVSAQIEGQSLLTTVDTLSSFSTLDSDLLVPRRRRVFVTLGNASPMIPRARFELVDVIQTQLCAVPPCQAGGATIEGVIGADLLSRQASRFNFAKSTLSFLPYVAGTAPDRAELCEGVVENAYHGDGTVVIDGGEIGYLSHHPTVSSCLSATQDIELNKSLNLQLVISTGTPISILSESAYQAYAIQNQGPSLQSLPTGQVSLATGPVNVRMATLDYLFVAGDLTRDEDERGGCLEAKISRSLANGLCAANPAECPCRNEDTLCRAAASMQISPQFSVAVLSDSDPLFRGLRDELRPSVSEVDGILSARDLLPYEIDFDYTNNRILWRCVENDTECSIVPAIAPNQTSLEQAISCAQLPQVPPAEDIDPDQDALHDLWF